MQNSNIYTPGGGAIPMFPRLPRVLRAPKHGPLTLPAPLVRMSSSHVAISDVRSCVELLTNTDLPETQKEDLSALLQSIRLYRRDEHMELIADKLEPLIVAGYTFIRKPNRAAAASPLGGSPQTVKLSRPRQLAGLTSSMNSRTVEATLDGYTHSVL